MQYARELPLDKRNFPYPAPPAFTSNQSQKGCPSASSVITFSDKTTVIDVTAFGTSAGQGLIIGKWGSASVTGTNFDWAVQSGQYRSFVIPVSVAGINSVAGANVANGLYATCAVNNLLTVAASVLTAEY